MRPRFRGKFQDETLNLMCVHERTLAQYLNFSLSNDDVDESDDDDDDGEGDDDDGGGDDDDGDDDDNEDEE